MYATLIPAIFILVVSLGLFLSNVRSRLRLLFFLYGVCTSVWTIVNYFSCEPNLSVNILILLNKIVLASGLLYGLISFIFIVELSEKYNKYKKNIIFFSVATFVSLILISTKLILKNVIIEDTIVYNDFGPLAFVYFITAMLMSIRICTTSVNILMHEKNANVRRRLYNIAVSAVILTVVFMVFSLILPMFFGVYDYVPYVPIAHALLAIAIARSIVRYELFDVRKATMRSTVYVFVMIFIAIIYFFITFVTSKFLLTDYKHEINFIDIVVMVLSVMMFYPLKSFFDYATDKIFFHNKYNTNRLLAKIGNRITQISNLDELLSQIGSDISESIKASSFSFYLFDRGFVGKTSNSRFARYDLSKIPEVSTVRKNVIIIDNLKYSRNRVDREVHDYMSKCNIEIIVRLNHYDTEIGYLLLGKKMVDTYSTEDVDVLKILSNDIAIAIVNIYSLEEVRDMNTHLEHLVNDATRKLRNANKRLVNLDKMKDEFVSMASHQLRTPLTSIKGYISMILDGDAGKISPTQRKMLTEAFVSSERMVRIISDFLNVSRLQAGKFTIECTQVDLAKAISEEIDSIRPISDRHGMEIVYRKPSRFPMLYIDDDKIRQVIANFIDNAIYYSPGESKIRVVLSVEDGEVVFKVIDHGMGVPADAQDKLFSKFFRADNAKLQRPDGTGVGLYLAKKVIDSHGGRVILETKYNKGSTFGFRLPIKKLSEPQK